MFTSDSGRDRWRVALCGTLMIGAICAIWISTAIILLLVTGGPALLAKEWHGPTQHPLIAYLSGVIALVTGPWIGLWIWVRIMRATKRDDSDFASNAVDTAKENDSSLDVRPPPVLLPVLIAFLFGIAGIHIANMIALGWHRFWSQPPSTILGMIWPRFHFSFLGVAVIIVFGTVGVWLGEILSHLRHPRR